MDINKLNSERSEKGKNKACAKNINTQNLMISINLQCYHAQKMHAHMHFLKKNPY